MSSFSFVHWIILFFVVAIVWSIFGKYFQSAEPSVCKTCGYMGNPNTVTPGSMGIEIILWLCLIIPGLIYSIWRGSARYQACPQCASREIIPQNSPMGKKLIEHNAAP